MDDAILLLFFRFLLLSLLCLRVYRPCENQLACVWLTELSPSPPVKVKV